MEPLGQVLCVASAMPQYFTFHRLYLYMVPCQNWILQSLLNVNLNDNNLEGNFPITDGSNEQAHVRNGNVWNKFEGTLPNLWNIAPALTRLELNGNKFTESWPGNVGKLIHLQELMLDGNSFEGRFQSLYSLKIWHFQHWWKNFPTVSNDTDCPFKRLPYLEKACLSGEKAREPEYWRIVHWWFLLTGHCFRNKTGLSVTVNVKDNLLLFELWRCILPGPIRWCKSSNHCLGSLDRRTSKPPFCPQGNQQWRFQTLHFCTELGQCWVSSCGYWSFSNWIWEHPWWGCSKESVFASCFSHKEKLDGPTKSRFAWQRHHPHESGTSNMVPLGCAEI